MRENSIMKKFDLGWISKYRNELFGLAIIYVISYHFIADVGTAIDSGVLSGEAWYAGFIQGFRAWHGRSAVELFVFLSGLGLYYSFVKNSDIKQFYAKRFKRIMIPYAIVAVIFWGLKDLVLEAKGLKWFVADISFYTFFSRATISIWFIGLLIFLYLVFPLIFHVIDKYKTKGFIVLLAISYIIPMVIAFFFPKLGGHIQIATTRVPMFVYGVYFARFIKANKKIPWLSAALITIAGFALKFITLNVPMNIFFQRYLEGLYTFAVIILLTVILHLISRLNIINVILRYFGKYSIELYLLPVTTRNVLKSFGIEGYRWYVFAIYLGAALIIAPWFSKLCKWIGSKLTFENNIGMTEQFSGGSKQQDNKLITDKQSGKQRIEWIDILKCILIFLVVLGHTTINKKTPDTLGYYIYAFHMPAFFMVSGMTFFFQTKSKVWTFGDMLKNKARQTLWPYLTLATAALGVWYFDYRILTNDGSFKRQVVGMFMSNGAYFPAHPTWFILVIFLVSMIFTVICMWASGKRNSLDVQNMTVSNDKVMLIAIVIIALAGYVSYMFEDTMFRFPWYAEVVPMGMLFFGLGFLLMKYFHLFEGIIHSSGKLILAFSVLLFTGIAAAACNGKVSMAVCDYHNIFLAIYAALALTGAAIIISMYLPKLRIMKMIGRNTIVILAWHTPLMWTLGLLFEPLNAFRESHSFLYGVMIFILMIPFAWAVERFCPILIGRTKKKAEN